MPVYNGERFIRTALDSLISQSFRDFELIISDNASDDKTHDICQEYVMKDSRIKYTRQSKNFGGYWNFNYVLKHARGQYFMWASVDDFWLPRFIEKNIEALDSNQETIGSISDIKLYDSFSKESKPSINDLLNRNSRRFQYVISTSGTIEERVRTYLKFFQASIIYSIFRTEVIKKSFISELFWANDLAIVLNTLKYGNLNVVDEILMYRYVPQKSISLIQYQLRAKIPIIKIIFLELPFTIWFLKNFGVRFFIENLDIFIKLNLRGGYVISAELLRMCKRITYGQKKFW